MTSTEIPMSEAEKQHLGIVDVRMGSQLAMYPPSQGHSVQPEYPPQQNDVSSGTPPSYLQTSNHIQAQPQPQTTVVRTAPRSTNAFSGAPRQQIPDYSLMAWIVTLCCCLPFGLIAVVMASIAKDKQMAGDYDEARSTSQHALGWAYFHQDIIAKST
ncbi:uncharacterized protein LOC115921507 [Strongylocentrotus purpuratus]|uniref:Uncharacterized protein n=1 Tax=Strongylocentrotus purpuratus TaxID=7668 RepID=A0A7M7SVT3_STRPU|nr:uncharacterized protein LOC115921507 [Strongylocentrotus purpuratus]